MRPVSRKHQIHRMARRALLAFKEGIAVQVLPAKFRYVNPLFRVAHLTRFDRPLLVSSN